jgi:23S rRNA (adenine2503-C2)-methyltransferase
MPSEKQDIKNLSLEDLSDFLKTHNQPVYRARQIFLWIYKKNFDNFDKMSDLSIELRNLLKEDFYIRSLTIVKTVKSIDRCQKFLFGLKDDNIIESVIIPTPSRITACISTQLGCRFRCAFCASGMGGFIRNLNCAEILEQVLYLKGSLWPKRLTHLVFMGMGEPLDNYDNLLAAIRIINSKYGLNIGARRITVSTCGLIPQIKRLVQEGLQVELSVSLHAADNKRRSFLMPVNKKYPLKELIKCCRQYVNETNRQITFEYVLIKGINSNLGQAKRLVEILKALNCKVNLIVYNPLKEFNFQPPDKLEVLIFRDYLRKADINVTLRKPRGRDIQAACGQLRGL